MDQTGIVIVEHFNLTAIENTRKGKITRFITDGITFLAIFYVFEHNSPADFCITYASKNHNFQNLLTLLTKNSVIEIPAENSANNLLKERKLAFLTQFIHKFIKEKLLFHAKILSLKDSTTLETLFIHISTK